MNRRGFFKTTLATAVVAMAHKVLPFLGNSSRCFSKKFFQLEGKEDGKIIVGLFERGKGKGPDKRQFMNNEELTKAIQPCEASEILVPIKLSIEDDGVAAFSAPIEWELKSGKDRKFYGIYARQKPGSPILWIDDFNPSPFHLMPGDRINATVQMNG